jgi:hypothetical protein
LHHDIYAAVEYIYPGGGNMCYMEGDMADFTVANTSNRSEMAINAFNGSTDYSFASDWETGLNDLTSYEKLAHEKTTGELLATQQTTLEKSLNLTNDRSAPVQEVSLTPADKMPGYDLACHNKVDTESVNETFKGVDQWLSVLEHESKQGTSENNNLPVKEEARETLRTLKDSLDKIYGKCGSYPQDIQTRYDELKARADRL